jgi:mannose-6-phosphate isomerase-like protein (cupin superfamily)
VRRLICSMAMSLDGFIAGPGDSIDWSVPDEELFRLHTDGLGERRGFGGCSVHAVASVGETIDNPVNGESITWIATAGSSAGQLLALDLSLRPGAFVATPHRHVRQEEHFEVKAGTIGLDVAGAQRTLGPGEVATVPIGVAHRWWNAGPDEAVVRVELRPALDAETMFEVFFGLNRDGKTNRKGMPGLLQIAVTARALGDSCPTLVTPPAIVQRVLFALLAPIGKLCGRQATYATYSPNHPSLSQ